MNLKLNSKGEQVKKIQEHLGLKPDGVFGPITEKKVKEWQKQNSIPTSGTIDTETWNRMFPNTTTIEPKNTKTKQTSTIKLEKLKGHLPQAVIDQIPEIIEKFGIDTPLRLSHFLSQCHHESGGFKLVQENLNYSKEGLRKIFSKYFTEATAKEYEKNPEKIASKVYGNRMGNGDETTKEGYKFRGRGYIQLTGKSNYQKFGAFIKEDLVLSPDLVATKYPLASAAFFFTSNKLWDICDMGSDEKVVTQLTKRINGGTIGLSDRLKHFKEYLNILS